MHKQNYETNTVSDEYLTDEQKIELLEHDIKNLEDMIHHKTSKICSNDFGLH